MLKMIRRFRRFLTSTPLDPVKVVPRSEMVVNAAESEYLVAARAKQRAWMEERGITDVVALRNTNTQEPTNGNT
jgi:hypothetical protein